MGPGSLSWVVLLEELAHGGQGVRAGRVAFEESGDHGCVHRVNLDRSLALLLQYPQGGRPGKQPPAAFSFMPHFGHHASR